MTIALQIENLSKEYRLGSIGHGVLYMDLQSWWCRLRGKEDPNTPLDMGVSDRGGARNFWALKGISLAAEQGKVLGIIGRNGAGKSTLLKIISRITAPTKGEVKIKGRVASLLEVGTGFHPELTGRENVFLNGAILGMTKAEVKSKFDEIVDFSGVGRFIDTPVKRYSSGMYVRLAFAVGAHLDPEILLVDEVLAVGDVGFQKKCLGKMGEVTKQGRTVLFVSHNIDAVSTLCDRVVWIDGGEIFLDGPTQEVVHRYMETLLSSGQGERKAAAAKNKVFYFKQFYPLDEANRPLSFITRGADLKLQLKYGCKPEIGPTKVLVNIMFGHARMRDMVSCPVEFEGQQLINQSSAGKLVCKIPAFPLVPGVYEIRIAAHVNELLVDKVTGLIRVTEDRNDDSLGSYQQGAGRKLNLDRLRGNFLVNYAWSLIPDN
jgi:ABC-type polysaccharide/polyol phosphate transport system ATPase subunit